jgi:thymidylate synthase
VNQVDYIVRKLSGSKLVGEVDVLGFSRRAQAITWKPWVDSELEHPPCLQRIWCRIFDGELAMETTWRSRDSYKAAFWNMYALTELQRRIADKLSAKTGREIRVGAYVDFTNSFHIYEKDFPDVERRFLKAMEDRAFEERTMTSKEFENFLRSRRRSVPLG